MIGGNYLFSNLPNDDCLVVVDESTLPIGYWQTSDPDESGAACTTCDASRDLTLSGVSNLNQDFGYLSNVSELLNWQANQALRAMCEDSWRWQTRNPNGYDPV